ncbi:LEA type 2 family protein [Rhodospira trueperi]|uniref:Late embryogenesis abundant protein n=1 Tax=Rhodospira trueperi TaxID=69960 RepID=A0A1G7GML2_9PROT|nr:LEA type 2 family protein [Rhodospira trueperi]SDE89346.1 Late embryogenesis abundant protein [Rhodospira trueperi]
MLSRRALVALALMTPLAACATAPSGLAPPDVALRDLRLVGAGLLQQDVDLLLSVTNPNSRDMPLNGLRVALDLNGQPLANGYSNASMKVPRLSTVTVPVRASISSLDLVRRFMDLGTRGGLDYALRGEALLDSVGDTTLPFEASGTLDLTADAPPPRTQ